MTVSTNTTVSQFHSTSSSARFYWDWPWGGRAVSGPASHTRTSRWATGNLTLLFSMVRGLSLAKNNTLFQEKLISGIRCTFFALKRYKVLFLFPQSVLLKSNSRNLIAFFREWEGLCGEECVHSRHKYLLWGIPLQQRELQQFFMAVTSLLFAGSPEEALHGRRGGWAWLSCGGTTWEGEETKKGLLLHITKGEWTAHEGYVFTSMDFLLQLLWVCVNIRVLYLRLKLDIHSRQLVLLCLTATIREGVLPENYSVAPFHLSSMSGNKGKKSWLLSNHSTERPFFHCDW